MTQREETGMAINIINEDDSTYPTRGDVRLTRQGGGGVGRYDGYMQTPQFGVDLTLEDMRELALALDEMADEVEKEREEARHLTLESGWLGKEMRVCASGWGEVAVHVGTRDSGEDTFRGRNLTSEEARRVAAKLIEAADAHDEVNA